MILMIFDQLLATAFNGDENVTYYMNLISYVNSIDEAASMFWYAYFKYTAFGGSDTVLSDPYAWSL